MLLQLKEVGKVYKNFNKNENKICRKCFRWY